MKSMKNIGNRAAAYYFKGGNQQLMKNLTIQFTNFKRALESCPDIKVLESRDQFDPPSEGRKKAGLSDLREEGFEVDDWLGTIIGLSKGNSMTYHVIRERQNRGEGSFNLASPQEYLIESEPWLSKNGASPADVQLLKRVRVIDQPSVAQTFTGLLMEEDSPPIVPDQLVYFRRGSLLKMTLGYRDYFEGLVAFMGFLNWQLLFTDADHKSVFFKSDFLQLANGYHDFVSLFPGREFTLWEAKLHERGLLR
jgi:hypothetical protein